MTYYRSVCRASQPWAVGRVTNKQNKHRRAAADPDCRGRFKVIASCRNLEELALPAFIANYSASRRVLLFACAIDRWLRLGPCSHPPLTPDTQQHTPDGKPVLITKSGSLHQGANYLEMSIRVHRFSYLAKKGLATLRGRFAQMVLDVAFLVEGRGDEELPEQLLGCARLHRLVYEKAAGEGVLPVGLMGGGGGGGYGANGGGR